MCFLLLVREKVLASYCGEYRSPSSCLAFVLRRSSNPEGVRSQEPLTTALVLAPRMAQPDSRSEGRRIAEAFVAGFSSSKEASGAGMSKQSPNGSQSWRGVLCRSNRCRLSPTGKARGVVLTGGVLRTPPIWAHLPGSVGLTRRKRSSVFIGFWGLGPYGYCAIDSQPSPFKTPIRLGGS